jgi:hypothetical protein
MTLLFLACCLTGAALSVPVIRALRAIDWL